MQPSDPGTSYSSQSAETEDDYFSASFDIGAIDGLLPTPISDTSTGTPHTEELPSTDTSLSVSTAFYPGANVDPHSSDVILATSDNVYFYVHSHKLLSASENSFHYMLPTSPALDEYGNSTGLCLPEPSDVINVVLHVIYSLPFSQYAPDAQTLIAAVDALKVYGVPVRKFVTPSSPIFHLLMMHAPLYPMEVYSMAGAHELEDLAIPTSAHLLSYHLSAVTDELAIRMGPVYLRRLCALHLHRLDELKRLMLPQPRPHSPTPSCGFDNQQEMRRVWALGTAYLAFEARPDLPLSTIKAALNPFTAQLKCPLCRETLQERLNHVVVQWSMVRRTI